MCVSTTRTYHDTNKHDQFRVQCPLRECRSNRSGVSGLPYYGTPPLTVYAVLGGLAVWRHNNKKKRARGIVLWYKCYRSAHPPPPISPTRSSTRHSSKKIVFCRLQQLFCLNSKIFHYAKCRGDWDLGLYTTSVLALGERMRDGKIRGKNVFRRRKNRILPLRCGSPSASTEVVYSPRSPLHIFSPATSC